MHCCIKNVVDEDAEQAGGTCMLLMFEQADRTHLFIKVVLLMADTKRDETKFISL